MLAFASIQAIIKLWEKQVGGAIANTFTGRCRAILFGSTMPRIPLQNHPTECGFVAAAAVLAWQGQPVSAPVLQERFGSFIRGMHFSTLRSLLAQNNCQTEPVVFDPRQTRSLPAPAIGLIRGTHFIFLCERVGKRMRVFDPERGWELIPLSRLSSSLSGVAVEIRSPQLSGCPFAGQAKTLTRLKNIFADVEPARALAVTTIIAMCGVLLQALAPTLTQQLFDQLVKQQGGSYVPLVSALAVIASLTVVSDAVAGLLKKRLGRTMSHAGSNWVFSKIVRGGALYLQRALPNSLYTKYVAADSLQERVTGGLVRATVGSVGLILSLAAIIWYAPVLMLPVIAAVVLVLMINRVAQNRIMVADDCAQQMQSHQRAFVLDYLPLIPAFNHAGAMAGLDRSHNRVVSKAAHAELNASQLSTFANAAASTVNNFERIAHLLLSGWLIQSGTLSLGAFIAASVYREQLKSYAMTIVDVYRDYRHSQSNLDRVEELVQISPWTDRRTTVATDEYPVSAVAVSFRHGSNDGYILKDVSISLVNGRIIALCGDSGSGKSTLCKLLIGELHPSSGVINVCAPQDERDVCASVTQTDRLLTASVLENIVFLRDGITHDQVWTALAVAGADEFVKAMPMRLDTLVGDSYGGLSGGQRQRLLIARAVLLPARALILDEATSCLDIETEAQILSRVRASGCAVFLCSHRPEVWKHADTVVELRDGSISVVVQDKAIQPALSRPQEQQALLHAA